MVGVPDPKPNRSETLTRVPVFSGLSEAELSFLAEHTVPRQFSAGIEITLPANNQELASQIGTVRELVSRNLSRFQAEGMLKIEGRTVIVTDLKTLEAELQSTD
jgi:Crp-like helix-turn-helix protein